MPPATSLPRVIVVGAGLGGLATAIALSLTGEFSILVLEAALSLGEIGAGIQISPNASRLLRRWQCDKYLNSSAVEPRSAYVRRWQSGEILQERPLNPGLEAKYGAPYYHWHRADLHLGLLQRARDLNVDVRVGSKVIKIDAGMETGKASATLESGETLDAIFIIGADGIKSTVRDQIFPGSPQPQPTGDLAYRFTIKISDLKQNSKVAHLAESPSATSWWGPGRHVVGYMLRGELIYNVVAVFPDDGSVTDIGRATAALTEMQAMYEGWDPVVLELMHLAEPQALLKWTLMDIPPLPSWTKGRVALIGDACHPMLPYLAQGSAQAIEDAATLAILLKELKNEPEKAAQLYQTLRKDRATKVQQYAREQRSRNHLLDGPAQMQRDAELRGLASAPKSAHSWQWEADEQANGARKSVTWIDGLYNYDPEDAARAAINNRC
ncbi:salicylate hydroxylase-like protein [Ilyonectria destructans]|nr:salicylate hydroxylase-like protein [Ilyonectria destructans]